MQLYQLIASGGYRSFANLGKVYSRRVFKTEPEAEAYAEEFRQMCCGEGLMDLSAETCEVRIAKLELQD